MTIEDGTLAIAYAWGSLADDNLQLATQTISGLHSGPGGVHAAEARLAAKSGFVAPLAALVVALAGFLAIRCAARSAASKAPRS